MLVILIEKIEKKYAEAFSSGKIVEFSIEKNKNIRYYIKDKIAVYKNMQDIVDDFRLPTDLTHATYDSQKQHLIFEYYECEQSEVVEVSDKKYIDWFQGNEILYKVIFTLYVRFLYEFDITPSIIRKNLKINCI